MIAFEVLHVRLHISLSRMGLLSTLGLRSKFVNAYFQVNLAPSNKTCVLPIILEYRLLLQIGKNDIIIHNII